MCEEIAKPKPETFRVCPLSEYGTFIAITEMLQEAPGISGKRWMGCRCGCMQRLDVCKSTEPVVPSGGCGRQSIAPPLTCGCVSSATIPAAR
jgi:hypothetical protein